LKKAAKKITEYEIKVKGYLNNKKMNNEDFITIQTKKEKKQEFD